MYNTTLDTDLIDLLEEAIKDLLKKYRCQDEEESSLGISNG
jgi:hypothetical protein